MMLTILAELALRSLFLGSVVWIGLNLLRVRNPHVHMTSWVTVLVASLSMPLLMHWTTVSITLDALPVPAPENLWSAGSPLPESLRSPLPSELGMPVAARGENYEAVNWLALATVAYAFVAGMLLLRLAVGICLTWRLARAAKPMSEPWTADWSVRVSNVIGGPVTFGSTILLPPQCFDWDLPKRQAVLAHEGAHVANRDFYVLLLASLNRAVFWFNPFAWWQLVRLAELAEIISDARALEVVEDKLSYAEILLDLVQHVRRAPAGLEMARACTIRARVERILAAPTAPAKLGWRKRIWTAAVILPVVIVSAGSIAYSTPPVSTLAVDGAADANDSGAQAPVCLLLFIGADIDLHRFSGRRRSLRATQRAAKTPIGRCRAMERIPTRPLPARSLWPSAMSDNRPKWCCARMVTTCEPRGSPKCRGKASRPMQGRSIHTSAGTSWLRTACSP